MTKSKLTADIETITPQEAKILLGKNDNNRNLRDKLVNHYVKQIEKGNWQLNGESIKVATDGTLLDGQHRLSAIIKAKKSVECLIVRNINKSVMATIDIGRSRSVGDHLKMQGISNGIAEATLAAAIAIVLKFENGTFVDSRDRLTPTDAIRFLEDNRSFLKLTESLPRSLFKMATPSVIIATYYLLAKIDRFKAIEFFDQFTTGERLGPKSPVLKLRNQLIEMRKDSRRSSFNKRVFLYYIVTAFEAFLHGKQVDGTFKYTANAVIELPKKRGG